MKNYTFEIIAFAFLMISGCTIVKAQSKISASTLVVLKISDNLVIAPITSGPSNIDFVYSTTGDLTSDKIITAPIQLGIRSIHPYDLVLRAESDFIGQKKPTISIPLSVMRVSIKDTEKGNYTQEMIPSMMEQVLLKDETKTPAKGRTYDVQYKIPKSQGNLLFKTEPQKYLTNFIYSFVTK